jgi:hypothetical protein
VSFTLSGQIKQTADRSVNSSLHSPPSLKRAHAAAAAAAIPMQLPLLLLLLSVLLLGVLQEHRGRQGEKGQKHGLGVIE